MNISHKYVCKSNRARSLHLPLLSMPVCGSCLCLHGLSMSRLCLFLSHLDDDPAAEALVPRVDLEGALPTVQRVLLAEDEELHAHDLLQQVRDVDAQLRPEKTTHSHFTNSLKYIYLNCFSMRKNKVLRIEECEICIFFKVGEC